ncbi:MAG TPA: hypothetical protein PLN36_05160 [Bacteroidales bacterium]|nr:hypothetical protein [Bacteroidales bacterium]
MKKINFKKFPLYANIEKTDIRYIDIHKEFAELLYNRGDGIVAHMLSHLIYESNEAVEIDDKQEEYLVQFIKTFCTPAMIESFEQIINKENNENS